MMGRGGGTKHTDVMSLLQTLRCLRCSELHPKNTRLSRPTWRVIPCRRPERGAASVTIAGSERGAHASATRACLVAAI
jgi:hypothetical protein